MLIFFNIYLLSLELSNKKTFMVGQYSNQIKTGQWYHGPNNVEHSAKFEQATDEIEIWFHCDE